MSIEPGLFEAKAATIKRGNITVLQGFNWCIGRGQQWAITGPSGCGKTSLLLAMAGKLFTTGQLTFSEGVKVVYVPQQHRFTNLSHTQDFYYQQRFNSFDADDAPTVDAAFPHLFDNSEKLFDLNALFHLEEIRHRPLIQLSNGENKRLQLAHALSQEPTMLLLDNPFTGLDAATRTTLETTLTLVGNHGIAVVITCPPQRIPSFITHVLNINTPDSTEVYDAATFTKTQQHQQEIMLPAAPQALLAAPAWPEFEFAVNMQDVHVQYGEKLVLNAISWQVRRGERWLLAGANGAGKSTLLSLITGDNPQAYANEIYLFDKKRGSGESIWDIKKNIGYVSPELHLYFDSSASVYDTIASGLFDTIGLFRRLTKEQEQKVQLWLEFLSLDKVKHRLLHQLPLGLQRLVLLARALIKHPPLLVLDEPLQGLDAAQIIFFNRVVDALCTAGNQTLIYVSHYADELPQSIEHHLNLHNGSIAPL
ncbi:ATP-binding cassette domain-containing protein [Pseudocnuella soli]|uniref:ATP-binding cassette domain-containing protein n=1 Tax=Pseudocnuella soli TaxID=2502779 RepID=UPI00104E63CA|nr:ATP-binding cassette domain-containing protein [Pseudocnuella soli]